MTYNNLASVNPTLTINENSLNSEQKRIAICLLKKKGIVGLGEDYEKGLWNSDDLVNLMTEWFKIRRSKLNILRPSFLKLLIKKTVSNLQSKSKAYEVAEGHYDIGNTLFKNMLDKSMTYTCGYWKNAKTLDEAQEAKLELICQKLQLKPNMKVLDIGCGWGNFAEYASLNYQVEVTGVTVSKEQGEYAKFRCKDLPVKIELKDYRDINGEFDRIVSIEMIEAVGKKNFQKYFDVISKNLKPNGLCLIQAITADSFSKTSSISLDEFLVWLIYYIFPNGYLPNSSDLSDAYKKGLLIEGIEEFGADYDKTLIQWHKNFTENWSKLSPKYSEEFKRRWEFYLLTCASVFRNNFVQLYQVLYSKKEF